MNESINGKKSIFYFPPDCIGYLDEQDGIVSFCKFEAIFKIVQIRDEDIEVFSVLVDDFLWVGEDYKLTDDEEKKAYFGKTAKGKKGAIEYSSIHARVAAVYTAICEGKIKIGERNLLED